jgi:CubicO group peptidase (beta-lactamase class C family)
MISHPSTTLSMEYPARSIVLPQKARDALTSQLFAALYAEFPAGFNVAVVDRSGTLLRAWGGNSNIVGTPIATTRDTIYDLASLTKVVSTTMLAMWLVDQKRWRLSDRVSAWLPGFAPAKLTLRHLLTHTSGLVAHKPFFHLGQNPRAVRRAVYEEATFGATPGNVLYSDLNFMLLGWAIEHCTGQPLQRLFRDVIATPLHLADSSYRPRERDRTRVAATELDGDQRLEPGLVWGEVHDGNAWSLGGVAGHAGLFSTADDLATYVTALLNPRTHPVLKASTITTMTRFEAGHRPDVRALGWRLEPEDWGNWPEGTYWHTGFTGTSLLVSPEANIGVVFLMNAVHPSRQLDRQQALRCVIHKTIAKFVA